MIMNPVCKKVMGLGFVIDCIGMQRTYDGEIVDYLGRMGKVTPTPTRRTARIAGI